MRLTEEQTRLVARTVSRITGGANDVYLFGSRLDDTARGGDVDLLLETSSPIGLIQRARIKMELEAALGLPVDILQHVRGTPATPFQTIAKARAVKLGAHA
jgi:predicted nucleotidyltransferase